MKDSEVLNKLSKGDESALDYLYKKYYRMMTNLVIKCHVLVRMTPRLITLSEMEFCSPLNCR